MFYLCDSLIRIQMLINSTVIIKSSVLKYGNIKILESLKYFNSNGLFSWFHKEGSFEKKYIIHTLILLNTL